MIAWHTCDATDMREEGRRRRESLSVFNKIQIWEDVFVFDGAVCVCNYVYKHVNMCTCLCIHICKNNVSVCVFAQSL
jgi:hypothetical protein